MRVTGMVITFIDVEISARDEYDRWCDLVLMPEMAALPGLAAVRRYHADDDIMAYRHARPESPPIGDARYALVCLIGDEDLDAAQKSLADLAARLRHEGRMFGQKKVTFSNLYRLIGSWAAQGIPVSADAMPHLAHVGIQIATGFIPRVEDIAEASAWYIQHYIDMLTVPGWLAALKFEPHGEEGLGRCLHMFLLDRPPRVAHEALEEILPAWRATGLSPHPRGLYYRTFSGPFASLAPLQHRDQP